MKKLLFFLLLALSMGEPASMAHSEIQNNNGMIIRISEIEAFPEYLEEYLTYAREVAETSVEQEKGVISIYPMAIIEDNNQIRILEIYRNQEAYKNHIASKHFQKYKKGTLHMIKSLNLIDTYQLSPKNFDKIFKRQNLNSK